MNPDLNNTRHPLELCDSWGGGEINTNTTNSISTHSGLIKKIS